MSGIVLTRAICSIDLQKSPARQLSHSLRRSFRRSKSPHSRLIAASGQPYSLSATASPEPTKKQAVDRNGLFTLQPYVLPYRFQVLAGIVC